MANANAVVELSMSDENEKCIICDKEFDIEIFGVPACETHAMVCKSIMTRLLHHVSVQVGNAD